MGGPRGNPFFDTTNTLSVELINAIRDALGPLEPILAYGSKFQGYNSAGVLKDLFSITSTGLMELYQNLKIDGTIALTGILTTSADIVFGATGLGAGKTLSFFAGTDGIAGEVVLVGGTKDVSIATIAATDIVLYSRKTLGGTPGNLSYVITPGSKVAFSSSSGTDTSTLSYVVLHTHS
jgi:hypothetical protein